MSKKARRDREDREGAERVGAYRDAGRLVLVEGMPMPQRCPICNSEDVVEPVAVVLDTQRKKAGISAAIGSAFEKLKGWKYTGPVAVELYFCKTHRWRGLYRCLIGLVMALSGLGYLAYVLSVTDLRNAGNQSLSIATIASLIALIGGFVVLMIPLYDPASVWFKPYKFWDRAVWVTGAGTAFLRSLPAYQAEERDPREEIRKYLRDR